MTRRAAPALVSVVIPALNVAETVGEQLAALAAQEYDGAWEVVVADNGSTDGTVDLVLAWRDRLPGLRVEHVARRGIAPVRNAGVAAAAGDLVVFCDGDDVVAPGWLAALAGAARDHDVVGGPLDDLTLNDPLVVAWRGELPKDDLMRPLGFLPFAPGGNCAIWKDVAVALRGWDPSYAGGSDDVAFCWRAQTKGYRVGFAPGAVLRYRYRSDLRSLRRQFHQYGRTEARLYRAFRAHGVPRPDLGAAVERWRWLAAMGRRYRRLSRAEQGNWQRELAYRLGRLRGSVEQRVFLP